MADPLQGRSPAQAQLTAAEKSWVIVFVQAGGAAIGAAVATLTSYILLKYHRVHVQDMQGFLAQTFGYAFLLHAAAAFSGLIFSAYQGPFSYELSLYNAIRSSVPKSLFI